MSRTSVTELGRPGDLRAELETVPISKNAKINIFTHDTLLTKQSCTSGLSQLRGDKSEEFYCPWK